MGLHQRLSLSLVAVAVLGGCSRPAANDSAAVAAPKADSIELVAQKERSGHFMAVSRQLELGGTVYSYMDVDGDALKVADLLHGFADTIGGTNPALKPVFDQDFRGLFDIAGFDDLKAIGLSSVPDGTGFFRNRAFFYFPNGRKGIMAGFGGTGEMLAHVHRVPADMDYYAESDIDLPAVYKTALELSEKVGGDTAKNAIGTALQTASDKSKIALLELINGLKGHVSLGIRFNGEATMSVTGPTGEFKFPSADFILRIDGVGQAITPALSRAFEADAAGSATTYHLKPELAKGPYADLRLSIDGGLLTVASSAAFLEECNHPKASLADAKAFKDGVAQAGGEGSAVQYITPHFYERIRAMASMNPVLPPQLKAFNVFLLSQSPSLDRVSIVVRSNLPDGILVRSYESHSLKRDILRVWDCNPISLGLIAAMAIPAYQKVQQNAAAMAANPEVKANLAKVSEAANRYFAATGKTAVRYDGLIGSGYLQDLTPVAGENYHALNIQAGRPLLIRMPTGQFVVYRPIPKP